MHSPLKDTRRVVVKVGTGVLTSGLGQLNAGQIPKICRSVSHLHKCGRQVIVVSSGAVGLGMHRLGLTKRPSKLSSLQKCAAVGQSILIETWQKGFKPHGLNVAQLLLTREDVRARSRHVAFKDLLEELLAEGIVPVINENDSVSTAEFQFGDNDILAALLASVSKSELLILLSTVPGLMDRKTNGRLISVVEKITRDIELVAKGTSSVTAVGGMSSKIQAAKIAIQSGCGVFIGNGYEPEIIEKIFMGQAEGTFFVPSKQTLRAHKRWLAFFEAPKGTVEIDSGAEKALKEHGGSLLAKGVIGYKGIFLRGDIINVLRPGSEPIARGISQFDHTELAEIAGKSTEEIRRLFPRRRHLEVIHRNALVRLT